MYGEIVNVLEQGARVAFAGYRSGGNCGDYSWSCQYYGTRGEICSPALSPYQVAT